MAVRLLDRAVGWRAGLAAGVQEVPYGPADAAIAQWSASADPSGGTPSGGAGWDQESARSAAVGELVERVGAGIYPADPVDPSQVSGPVWPITDFACHTPEQVTAEGFPYRSVYEDQRVVQMRLLTSNQPVWVPAAVAGFGGLVGIATSSGLAAAPSHGLALLRATQELVERDALMTTWLYGVASRRVAVPDAVREVTDPLQAQVTVLDLTPAYSPHPVAAVAGSSPADQRLRCGVGVACRASWEDALRKALLEWAQAITFTGWTTAGDPPGSRTEPAEVTSFDEHARFYTRRPDLWAGLAWFTGPAAKPPPDAPAGTAWQQLEHLVGGLDRAGVRLCYRDLTTLDSAACGVKVVRVVSPDVAMIHADHRWPLLRLAPDRAARLYPGLPVRTPFPSPYPHPLG